MADITRVLTAALASALLAACASTPQYIPTEPPPPPRDPAPVVSTPEIRLPPPAPTPSFRDAEVMDIPGLENVIRANASALEAQFGPPQLDVREGDMRKLQFSGPSCVLDVFLYPPNEGDELLATWVEARRASDGAPVDRAACVAALKR